MKYLNPNSEDLLWLLNHLFIKMYFKVGDKTLDFDSAKIAKREIQLWEVGNITSARMPWLGLDGPIIHVFTGIMHKVSKGKISII